MASELREMIYLDIVWLGISLFISLTTAFSTDISYTCPAGWEIHRTQCYLYVGESRTQSLARNDCLSEGGDLLSIWNPVELYKVREFIKNRIASSVLLTWTGLTRTSAEGEWKWTDGSLQQHFTWYKQPASNEMCALILTNGRLFPASCAALGSVFVCKREAVVAYELGLPWETLPGVPAYNATVTGGRESMFHLSTDVDDVLSRLNISTVSPGRNEADCGLICMKTTGCTAFVFKCRQSTGCERYDCVFGYS